ncbi:hypothetical protein F511_31038 [Dorcoceras hygrometricum]|uniref:Uncharacterized protein n=1 Tax=Dorcoceras hygrometricum TaxID=472368 RepID=A0A2Z7CMS5_9LAMI|nr:hypothetical protein F511_31038 [Dorcoceras hygrometricum]
MDELEVTPTIGAEEESVRKGYPISLHRAKLLCTKSSSRADDKSKLEELLKSGCKREEKKRDLDSSMKQPARSIQIDLLVLSSQVQCSRA